MQEKYYMKPWELFAVILNLTIYKIFTVYSRVFVDTSGPGAAISALLSGAAAFLVVWLLINLQKKYKGKTLIEIAEEKLGDWAKYIIFALIFVYLLFSAAMTLCETGEFIRAVSFPSAPLMFIFLFIIAGSVICCAQGFDAIGRTHSIVIPFAALVTVIITLFAIPKGTVSNLTPYLGGGAKSVFLNGLSGIGLYGDLIILFMLAPFSNPETKFKSTALLSVGTGVLINFLVILSYTMSAPYEISKTIIHPMYQLVKLFSMGKFLQRTDGYFLYISTVCGILSVSLNLFFAAYAAKEVFLLPKVRPLSYPLGAAAVFLALLPESREGAYSVSKNSLWVWFAVIFAAVFLTLAVPRKGKEKCR